MPNSTLSDKWTCRWALVLGWCLGLDVRACIGDVDGVGIVDVLEMASDGVGALLELMGGVGGWSWGWM